MIDGPKSATAPSMPYPYIPIVYHHAAALQDERCSRAHFARQMERIQWEGGDSVGGSETGSEFFPTV